MKKAILLLLFIPNFIFSQKDTATLGAENTNTILNATLPENITQQTIGSINQDIISSFYNRIDDNLTPSPRSLSVSQLATEITNSTLVDKQWITITGRGDGFPLIVQCHGANLINPFGIWIKSGKPLSVIMDYTNGYDGQTNPFIAVFDENRSLSLPNQIIIADASKGDGKVLVSDANGKSTWKIASWYQSSILNPASMTGASELMMGLSGTITPTKSGIISIRISGNYTSSDSIGVTTLKLRTGTGTPPNNGDGTTGTIKQSKTPTSSSTTKQQSFSFNWTGSLTVNTTYWIDLSTKNAANGTVRLYDISISITEL